MSSTAVPWSPTRILDFVESYTTACGVAEVETDTGPGYLKPLGNRQGPHELACELVGTALAKWFGLRTFDFAVVNVVDANRIPLHGTESEDHDAQLLALPGPAFITAKERGRKWNGTATQLNLLTNPRDICLLVAFDTWTLNSDRYFPPRITNFGNVFLSEDQAPAGQLALLSIDHGHCFSGGGDPSSRLGRLQRVRSTDFYGLFPAFAPRIAPAHIARAVQRLSEVDDTVIRPIVDTVPREWEVPREASDALVQLLTDRAQFLAPRFEQLLNDAIREM